VLAPRIRASQPGMMVSAANHMASMEVVAMPSAQEPAVVYLEPRK
jgi:hypothetical protein